MHTRGAAVLLAALGLMTADAMSTGAASTSLSSSPPGAPSVHTHPHLALANANFSDDELVDSKKAAARLEGGPCSTEQCQSHCKQKLHASGRCDQDLCVCRDLKARGRCQVIGFGCGSDSDDGAAGRANIVNNNNNNNVLVVH